MDNDQDLYSSHNGRDGGYGDPSKPVQAKLELKPVPMYIFYNTEELVTSEVFQRQLALALKSKEKQIHELRVELLDLHEAYDSLINPEE